MPSTKKNYTVDKILNNSSLIAKDLLYEIVFIGRGIGFGLKPGDTFPKNSVYDKSYKLLNRSSDFKSIINGYDEDTISMVMDTIRLILKHDNEKFTSATLISLADHLAAAFTRIINDEAIVSFFSHEIKALYPESYIISKGICDVIIDQYHLKIPDAEVSYIALHIQNLSNRMSSDNLDKLNSIVAQIEKVITLNHSMVINKDSVQYSRFLTHVRFIIESALSRKEPLNDVVNSALISTYQKEVEIGRDIISIIENELNTILDDSELTYIVIHLVNIISK